MKKIYLLLWLAACSNSLHAQGVFSTKTTTALQKVIEDYPNRFRNIKGDRLAEHTRAVDYHSRVVIAGAANPVITQYSTSPKEQYAWSCELAKSDSFDKAKATFQSLYNQISNTIIKIEGEKPFILNGRYEVPDAGKKLNAVRFELLAAPEAVQTLKVELTLIYTTEWKIVLAVYDQEKLYDVAMQHP